jgi:hypothetical protein
MAEAWANVPQKRLCETISLLYTVNDIIVQPTENPPPIHPESTRRLTIEQELNIVEILAFLSATHADPLKVMAVCIEEGDKGDSLLIRLATNTGDCSDVVNGFQRMAKILERCALRGD